MNEDITEILAQLQHENLKLVDELKLVKEHTFSVEEALSLQSSELIKEKKHVKSLEQQSNYFCQMAKEKDHLIELLEHDKKKLIKINTELTSEKLSFKEKLMKEKLKNRELETLKIQEEELKKAYAKLKEENQKLIYELSLKSEECFLNDANEKNLLLQIKSLSRMIEFWWIRHMLEMNSVVPKIKLNNDLQIPILGLGTWKSKPGDVTEAVKYAVEIGYRHFDCAYIYQNEKEVGVGLSEKIAEGLIKREDIWVTSKLWNTDHHPSLVEGALRRTLSNLKLTYLDLYLIHWPHGFKEGEELFPVDENGSTIFSDVDYVDTWRAMEECVKKGLTKSIGLSNFNSEQIERVLAIATIKPVVNQVECHPYLAQKKLSEFCKKRDIVITAYSPLGSPDRPSAKPEEPVLLEEKKLKELAAKYGKTPAQILIRYQFERGNVTIPKSVTKKRIKENFDVFDFSLNSEDIKVIDSFDKNGRLILVTNAKAHMYYPFNLEF